MFLSKKANFSLNKRGSVGKRQSQNILVQIESLKNLNAVAPPSIIILSNLTNLHANSSVRLHDSLKKSFF